MAIAEAGQQWLRARQKEPIDVLASDVDGALVVPQGMTAAPTATTTGQRWEPHEVVPTRRRGTPPEWLPLALAFAGWPLWWALGLTQMVFIGAAIPLAWALRRRGTVRLPPGFGFWLLFLALVLVSGFALDVDAAGTLTSSGSGRYIAFGFRFLNYVALTVILLYIGNTKELALPRARIIGWIGWLGFAAISLGLLALVLPNLQFTSPTASILPEFLSDGRVNRLAQVQPVLGDPTPRPAAPFAFTNAWGNNTSLLVVWLIVAWGVLGSRRRRFALAILLLLSALPIVYSLNRGMWIGLGLALFVVAVRLALRGRTLVLAATFVVLIVGAIVFVLSPLQDMVNARLEAGHSNDVRGSLASQSIEIAKQSPILGFGSSRDTIGSTESIAIGQTEDCPRCGNRAIGSTGQFTLLLVAQGFLGLGLYVGFFLRSLIAYRGDHSPLGIAATVVVGMELFYGFFYSALTMPLAIAFVSLGLLWRNAQIRGDVAGVA
jgi:hypothetical protein